MFWNTERQCPAGLCTEGSASDLPACWLWSWLSISDGFDGTHKYCSIVIKGARQYHPLGSMSLTRCVACFLGAVITAAPKGSRPNDYRVSGPASTENLQNKERLDYALSDVKGAESNSMYVFWGLQVCLDRTIVLRPPDRPPEQVGNILGSGGESRPHRPKGTAVDPRLQQR